MRPMRRDGVCSRVLEKAARAMLGAMLAGLFAGCSTDQTPTKVMVTPIASTMLPAKPADCDMPVLIREPSVSYQQIAIVEAWANVDEDPANVLPELKRQACATGAQALLIVDNRKQDIHTMLYGVTPNATHTEVTSENKDPNQAATYIRMMQHHPRVGEEGHSGFYIDALAIEYTKGSGASAASNPPGR